MSKYFLIICLLLPFLATPNKTDSLKVVLEKAQGEKRVTVLNELGSEYLGISLDSSQLYIKKALKLAESLNSINQLALVNKSYGKLYFYKGIYDSSLFYTKESVKLFYQSQDSANLCLSLNNLGIMYSVFGMFDSSLSSHGIALEINIKLNDSNEISETYNNIGSIHLYQSQFDSAIFFYKKALSYVDLDAYSTRGAIFNNIALTYNYKGDYEKAIETYLTSLELFEKIDDIRTITQIYNNIGSIYMDFEFYDKAISYFQKKADYAKGIGDHLEYCKSVGNIAGCYASQSKTDSAINLYQSLFPLFKTFDDKDTKALANKGMADCLLGLNKSQEALEYLEKALEFRILLNDSRGINRVYLSMAMAYINLEQYKTALLYFNKCDQYLKESQDMDLLLRARIGLSEALFHTGSYIQAYNTLAGYVALKDSIMGSNAQKQISDLETKYQTEKKEQQLALQDIELAKNQETIAREKAESDKKAAQRNLLMIGFGLILVLAIVIYRGYKQKTQANVIIGEKNEKLNVLIDEVTLQKDEIENQKIEIEEIHHEVSQSINYAERIQRSILPEVKTLKDSVDDHFVLFKPRDVVSGDFYWFTKLDNQLFATVADCTGHGVPGAFMSMLGVSLLREIVNKNNIKEPNKILYQLRHEIVRTLKQKGVSGEQKDGMDMAFIKLDTVGHQLQYAGAHNALFVISKKEPLALSNHTQMKVLDLQLESDYKLYEVKADKMPIAIYEKMDAFVNHEIQLTKGDQVYIFSDGYVDQFGGLKDKKFMTKPFKRLLLNNASLPMQDQQSILDSTIKEWMQNSNQLDDISIMGLKV